MKRAADGAVVQYRTAKRPVEKSIITATGILGASVTAQTVSLTGTGAAGPVSSAMTYSGGNIQVTYWNNTTAVTLVGFALIILRQGTTVNAPALTGSSTFYAPEQDVLWSWYAIMPPNNISPATTQVAVGKIKSMRKLKLGDAIVFVGIGSAATSVQYSALITSFFKE